MAAELCDIRAKVTVETQCVLTAYAETHDVDVSEVVRDILRDWSSKQILLARHILGAMPEMEPIAPAGRVTSFKRAPISMAVRLQIFERHKGQCAYCYVPIAQDEMWHVDHVLPVSQGGTNDLANLAVACPACNLSKSGKTPEQWQRG